MTNLIPIVTTLERARRLRGLLDTTETQSVGGVEPIASQSNDGSVVVRLLSEINADDTSQVDAEIMVLNGQTWEGTGQTFKVRCVTGESVGTQVRKVARRVGRFGWVVENPTSQNTIRFQIYEADCEGRSSVVKVLSSGGSIPGSYEIYGETETNEAGEVVNSKFVIVYDKTGCYLNESNKNLFGRIGHATYLTGRPKYPYQPWTGFEIVALAEQQTECEAF